MSISQFLEGSSGTSQAFGGVHQVIESGDWDQPLQTFSVPGAIGVGQLLDYRKQRRLSCEYRIDQYDDYADIAADLETIDALNQTLTGDVVVTGTLVMTYQNCTFLGFSRGPVKYDGSGENGWWVEGRLHWIQRSPNV